MTHMTQVVMSRVSGALRGPGGDPRGGGDGAAAAPRAATAGPAVGEPRGTPHARHHLRGRPQPRGKELGSPPEGAARRAPQPSHARSEVRGHHQNTGRIRVLIGFYL